MDRIERSKFFLWAETEEHQSRIQTAKNIISEALDQSKCPYLAYSGGKDSLVMLHMVLQKRPDILVWHWDYGYDLMPFEMEKEILENARRIGAKNIRINSSGKGENRYRSVRTFYRQFFGKIGQFTQEEGCDLAFIGLRTQESGKRKRKASEPFRWNGKLLECYPLADLTARDIWAYIVTNNLPYCSHYDRYGALLGIEQVRMSTFFDPEFDMLGASNIDGLLMPEFKQWRKNDD